MKAATLLAGVLALVCSAPAVQANDYPNKPITLIIGFAPGGPSDVMARILTKRMEELLRQPVIIENRAGAGGGIAANLVARAPADGYTILLATGSSLAINVSLYKNLGYDPEKDFDPISLIGVQTNVLYTHPSVPASTIREFVDYAKANPGKLSFGSGGNGTPAHLAGELLKIRAGIQFTHIPFRGTGPAMTELQAGRIDVASGNLLAQLPLIKTGKLKPLAIFTNRRSKLLPDLPSAVEAVPAFNYTNWIGMVVPAATPRPVVMKLNEDFVKMTRDPELVAAFDESIELMTRLLGGKK